MRLRNKGGYGESEFVDKSFGLQNNSNSGGRNTIPITPSQKHQECIIIRFFNIVHQTHINY